MEYKVYLTVSEEEKDSLQKFLKEKYPNEEKISSWVRTAIDGGLFWEETSENDAKKRAAYLKGFGIGKVSIVPDLPVSDGPAVEDDFKKIIDQISGGDQDENSPEDKSKRRKIIEFADETGVAQVGFKVVLSHLGEEPDDVLDYVRDLTGKKTKEVKTLCATLPVIVFEGEEGETQEVAQRLIDAGAKVEIKSPVATATATEEGAVVSEIARAIFEGKEFLEASKKEILDAITQKPSISAYDICSAVEDTLVKVEVVAKENIQNLATKDDIKDLATKGDISDSVTTEDFVSTTEILFGGIRSLTILNMVLAALFLVLFVVSISLGVLNYRKASVATISQEALNKAVSAAISSTNFSVDSDSIADKVIEKLKADGLVSNVPPKPSPKIESDASGTSSSGKH